MREIRTSKKPNSSKVRGDCQSCLRDTSCGGYHVYVIELDSDANYHFYVGQTGKTVGQRLIDNWEKYGTRGNGPRLIRNNFLRMRMDLVPKRSILCQSREKAESLEAELADSLRNEGYRVRGPTNGEGVQNGN